MKDKVLRIVKKVALIVGILVVLALILHIPAVDRMLTDWIGSPLAKERTNYRIVIEDYEQKLPETKAPYFYEEDGKLWLLQGGAQGGAIDVTPEGVNVSFYASKHNVTQELRMRKQCTVSEDGRRILFLLNDHDIPTLFLTDLEAGTTEMVATNVDSFLFVGTHIVYACGYEQANQLYTYADGEAELLASNVQSLPLPLWNCIASLDYKGVLRLHNMETGITKKLDSDVKEIYEASSKAARLPEATVFCRKADGDYRISLSKTTKLKTDYLREIDTSAGVSQDGLREYLYCEAQGTIQCAQNGKTTQLFKELGFVQRIFSWNEGREELIVATQDGIYLLRPQAKAGKTVCLLAFEDDYDIYRDNLVMVRDFLELYRVNARSFYVQAVSEDSFILNKSRPESWMNFMSSYLYGLSYIELNADGRTVNTSILCEVPSSRTIETLLIRDDVVAYKSTYDDHEIRSVTTLKKGVLLEMDLLHTHRESKGQVDIAVEKIGDEIYFTLVPWGGKPEYSVLGKDGKTISGVGHRVVSSMGDAYELK